MMEPQKKKWPHENAMFTARSLVEELRPFCDRIEIAGSLRRQKLEVGDIEILYISKPGKRQVDLLDTEDYGEAEKHLDFLLYKGVLSKRPNKNGVCAWGRKNKLALHCETGIPVDFFSTNERCWWNSLVCRTGGKQNNLLITTTARKKGYSFEAYGEGFRELRGSRFLETHSERDVYEFIGLPYLEPHQRK